MADPYSPQEIVRRAERLKGDRSSTDSHWQEVSDYLMPSREFQGSSTPGSKRMSKIYHTGPVMAAENLAGSLHGMLTSPALRWAALRPDNAALGADKGVRMWFDAVTDAMFRVFTSPTVKFDLHMHENYLDQAAFGTSVLFMPDRGMAGPGFMALPLKECFFSESADGVVDVLFRCFEMRAQDVAQHQNDRGEYDWAKSLSAEEVRRAEDRPDEMWECVQGILPDKKTGEYVSVYVLKRGMVALGEPMTYQDKPFIVPRWAKRSGEWAGNGPGMNALPDVKLLNKLEEENLRGVMLANAPPLAVPDDGFLSPVMQQPRHLNYYRSSEGPNFADRVFPINTSARPDIAAEKIAQIEQRVSNAFYVQWMNLPFKSNMTATEVMQRRDEMLRMMGPMVARFQAEALGPIIERTFNVMWRNGMLPAPPAELSGSKWHVEYMSPLAIAQKSSDAQAALQFLQVVAQMAAADPNAADKVDNDKMVDFLADRMGAPMQIMRTDDVIAQLRQARQERQQQMEQMGAVAEMAKGLQAGGAGVEALAGADQAMQQTAAA